jgi:hypothetical protein
MMSLHYQVTLNPVYKYYKDYCSRSTLHPSSLSDKPYFARGSSIEMEYDYYAESTCGWHEQTHSYPTTYGPRLDLWEWIST